MTRALVIAIAALACATCAACGRIGFGATTDAGTSGDAAPDAVVEGAVPPDFVDGTRLRAYRAVGDDTVGQRLDWYDTTLDELCDFAATADGDQRCLPTNSGTGYFADPSCTVEIAQVGGGPTMAGCSYTEHFAIESAYPVAHVYQLGAPYNGQLYAGGLGNCNAVAGAGTFYLLGSEVPLTTFVAGTERITPHGRLSAIELVTPDGASQQLDEFVDNSIGDRCAVRELENGHAWCVPLDSVTNSLAFSDAACTQPAVISNGVATTAYSLTLAPTPCLNNYRVFAIGPEVVGPAFQAIGAGCAQVSLPASDHVYTGIETPLAQLDALTLVIDPASGRLHTTHWRDAEGNGVADQLYDAQRGGRCAPGVEESTELLTCLPRDIDNPIEFFSDATCMTYMDTGKLACRDATTADTFMVSPAFSCDGQRRQAFGYDSPLLTPPVYIYDNAVCTAVDLTATPAFSETPALSGVDLAAMVDQRD